MSLAFEIKDCYSDFPSSISPFDWGGDYLPELDIMLLGPEFPIPPPPEIYAGCICPRLLITTKERTDTEDFTVEGSIVPKSGDCCDFDIVIDITPPCIPEPTGADITGTLVPSSSIGRAAFSVSAISACEWEFALDIEWPCPTQTIETTVTSNRHWLDTYGPEYWMDDGEARNIREGSLSVSTNKNLDDCNFTLDVDIVWPCTVAFGSNVITQSYADWYAYDPSSLSSTRAGAFQLTTVRESSDGQPACDFRFDIDINWPCPTALTVAETNVEIDEGGAGYASLTINQPDANDLCNWELQLNIGWPPSIACPITFNETSTTYSSTSDKNGTIDVSMSALPDCEFRLNVDVVWPCPTSISTTSTTWSAAGYSSSGTIDVSLTPADEDCNINIDFDITTPCTDTQITLSVLSDLDPSSTAYVNESLTAEDADVCFKSFEYTIHLPSGIALEFEDDEELYTEAFVDATFSNGTLTFTKGQVGGGAGAEFARITSVVGTDAPFIYSAEFVTYDGSFDYDESNFTGTGVFITGKLINLWEITNSGTCPLEVDTLLPVWPMNNIYACSMNPSRGTY